MSLLLYEVEQAFVALLSGAAAAGGAGIYGGMAPTEKVLPCVICAASGTEEEDPPRTGNFWVNMAIMVKATAAADVNGIAPTPAEVALASSIFALVQVSDLDAQLNAQGRNLTVMPQGFFVGSPTESAENDVWTQEMVVRLYCCGSVLAA